MIYIDMIHRCFEYDAVHLPAKTIAINTNLVRTILWGQAREQRCLIWSFGEEYVGWLFVSYYTSQSHVILFIVDP